MIYSLPGLLIPLLLLTPALASAAPAQGRPAVAGNWLVRVAAPQPFTVVLSVDEHGGVLTPRALSRVQTIVPTSAARTDSGLVVRATAWERENTLDVAVRGDSLRGTWSGAGQPPAPAPASGVRLPRETLAPLTGTAVFDSVVGVLDGTSTIPATTARTGPGSLPRRASASPPPARTERRTPSSAGYFARSAPRT